MLDAHKLMAEALVMMREAETKLSKVNKRISAECNLASTHIRAEWMHHSREPAWLHQKLDDILEKQDLEHDVFINQMQSKSDKKLDRVRHDMFAI
jgi:hypothetical protein